MTSYLPPLIVPAVSGLAFLLPAVTEVAEAFDSDCYFECDETYELDIAGCDFQYDHCTEACSDIADDDDQAVCYARCDGEYDDCWSEAEDEYQLCIGDCDS